MEDDQSNYTCVIVRPFSQDNNTVNNDDNNSQYDVPEPPIQGKMELPDRETYDYAYNVALIKATDQAQEYDEPGPLFQEGLALRDQEDYDYAYDAVLVKSTDHTQQGPTPWGVNGQNDISRDSKTSHGYLRPLQQRKGCKGTSTQHDMEGVRCHLQNLSTTAPQSEFKPALPAKPDLPAKPALPAKPSLTSFHPSSHHTHKNPGNIRLNNNNNNNKGSDGSSEGPVGEDTAKMRYQNAKALERKQASQSGSGTAAPGRLAPRKLPP
ncbi:hypothetical protein SK128_016494 [Halocaridina rubra]|uniref:Uncharacterized protein n=1 Tax=Halocaridina rubra TaxID=373956 RepID=A0AAN9ADX8_HALRR